MTKWIISALSLAMAIPLAKCQESAAGVSPTGVVKNVSVCSDHGPIDSAWIEAEISVRNETSHVIVMSKTPYTIGVRAETATAGFKNETAFYKRENDRVSQPRKPLDVQEVARYFVQIPAHGAVKYRVYFDLDIAHDNIDRGLGALLAGQYFVNLSVSGADIDDRDVPAIQKWCTHCEIAPRELVVGPLPLHIAGEQNLSPCNTSKYVNELLSE